MHRVGFILKIKKSFIDEYMRRDEEVWPEMNEALQRRGWHNYSLFTRDYGMDATGERWQRPKTRIHKCSPASS